MNNAEVKNWAAKTVRKAIQQQLSPRSQVDILKAAAVTETLLGHFRGYRNEVYAMEFDFSDDIAALEKQTGAKLGKGQESKIQDMLTAQLRSILRDFKEFESILGAQLKMIETLPETKQEVLHQLDEQSHEEQMLMRAIYEKVVREGKKMVNINQLKKQLNIS
jgi:hypothetical protein